MIVFFANMIQGRSEGQPEATLERQPDGLPKGRPEEWPEGRLELLSYIPVPKVSCQFTDVPNKPHVRGKPRVLLPQSFYSKV